MTGDRPADDVPPDDGPLSTLPASVIDPRAVRVTLGSTSRGEDDPTMTISPVPQDVLRPVERLAGRAILGGVPTPLSPPPDVGSGNGRSAAAGGPAVEPGSLADAREPVDRDGSDGTGRTADGPTDGPAAGLLIDGRPLDARLIPFDAEHARLVEGPDGPERVVSRVILGIERRRDTDGAVIREVVVDGWRFEVEIESERRASLRERARRGHEVAGKSGPVEIHAIIPGRIVALSVKPGDPVTAGQQLLVLEAMKMQNELRAPREGAIERIAISVGENVEVGDLLMVIT
jgi:biotin carboxyl carrier protein